MSTGFKITKIGYDSINNKKILGASIIQDNTYNVFLPLVTRPASSFNLNPANIRIQHPIIDRNQIGKLLKKGKYIFVVLFYIIF